MIAIGFSDDSEYPISVAVGSDGESHRVEMTTRMARAIATKILMSIEFIEEDALK